MIRTYAIIIGLLQGFLWVVVRRVAIDTYACLQEYRGGPPSLPPLSKLIYLFTPYAWAIPVALLIAVGILWKKEEKRTTHALGVATVIFLSYLALCAIGFVIPFIPKLSELTP